MLYGAPFLLVSPLPKEDAPSSLWRRIKELFHNYTFIEMVTHAFHCAYFGLLFVDKWLGMKLYVWAGLPIILLTIVTILHMRGDE